LFGAVLPVTTAGNVKGSVRLTVGSEEPLSPAINDVWIDTT